MSDWHRDGYLVRTAHDNHGVALTANVASGVPRIDDGGAPQGVIDVTPEDFHAVALDGNVGAAGAGDGAEAFERGYQNAMHTVVAAFFHAYDVLGSVAAGIDQELLLRIPGLRYSRRRLTHLVAELCGVRPLDVRFRCVLNRHRGHPARPPEDLRAFEHHRRASRNLRDRPRQHCRRSSSTPTISELIRAGAMMRLWSTNRRFAGSPKILPTR